PQEALRPLGDGRGAAAGRRGDEPQAIEERKERAAHQPNIDLGEDKEELERVLSGQSDLAFTMSYEALPEITVTDLTQLKLERPVAEVTEEAIDKGVASLAERSTRSPSISPAAWARRSSRAARARTSSWWWVNRVSFRDSSRASRAPRPVRS